MDYPPPRYGYPAYGPPPPDHPQATTVLILGLLGVVFCQLVAPFAWVMGKRALNEIDASGGTVGGRNSVMAGYVCGIIGTVFIVLAVIGVIVWLVALFAAIGTSGTTVDSRW
ncbi:DUF4190 domain-containing protein [Nocardia brevicatena]|uniref:DUF4190 domain-containing protein n=1 Tax=Nocardia brevicatena TaxID=37327 RepID=UPI0002E8D29C|nr:DUF4190 domain-containing protein [Nocardia brevicatena]